MCSTHRKWESVARHYGNVCYLCGEEIDLSLRSKIDERGRPQKQFVDAMPTLDHIIPRSKGGGNRVTNLRLTHHKCNNKRGNESVTYCMMLHMFFLNHPIQ